MFQVEAIIGKNYPKQVIPLIENAKSSIKIVIFDWRWYPDDPANPVQLFNQAIIRAVRRGVKVSVVANCDEVLRILKQQGCETKKPITKNLIHAKMLIFDDESLVIGSHNLTQYAFTMNHEISVFLSGVEEMKPFLQFFNSLFY